MAFLSSAGTWHWGSGRPTGISRKGLSFAGLPKSVDKKFIGLGVCVRATKPALCKAANKKPQAIPTVAELLSDGNLKT